MSPSQRRKDLWKKSVRKQRKHLQKQWGGVWNQDDVVVFGLTEGIQMVYVEAFVMGQTSGKVYLPKSLTNFTTSAIVRSLLVEARLHRS